MSDEELLSHYRLMRGFDRRMGLSADQTLERVRFAYGARAPADAIYLRHTVGKWRLFEELEPRAQEGILFILQQEGW